MTGTTSWRAALRIARRDVARARGRTALVAAMVGLPVLLLTVLATLQATNDVSARESMGWRLGTTQAALTDNGAGQLDQDPDGNVLGQYGGDGPPVPWTAERLQRLTGGTVLDVPETATTARTPAGRRRVTVFTADLRDPRLAAIAPVSTGRPPRAGDEVVVSPALAARGLGVGSTVQLGPRDLPLRVVGVTEQPPDLYGPTVVWASPTIDLRPAGPSSHRFLLDRADPVPWPEVRELNARGVAVLSRAVVEHPPAHWRDTLGDTGLPSSPFDDTGRAVLVLLVFSIALEVVLLAGPAFAVGVRRQQRSLALLAAVGGTPADVRRVVLVQALVTGGLAAVAGAGLGVAAAAGLAWLLPRVSSATLGPFDVAWRATLAGCALGALAAVVAALVPARAAARADVVAVLAGRRGQLPARRGLPVLGVLLMAAGAAVALGLGTRQGGEVVVACGSVLMVLGAIATLPAAIGLVGRLAGRLPLPLRLAARDSARQRSRTAPAVAAVMAAVAGVTALAIGVTSDTAQARRDYRPTRATGVTTVTLPDGDQRTWAQVEAAVAAALPGRRLLPTGSLADAASTDGSTPAVYVAPRGCPDRPTVPGAQELTPAQERCSAWQQGGVSSPEGTASVGSAGGLVGEPASVRALGYHLDDRQERVLRSGGVLVPHPALVDPTGHARVTAYRLAADGSSAGDLRTLVVPAAPQPRIPGLDAPDLIATPATAARLGLAWTTSGGVLSPGPTVSAAQEDRVREAVLAVSEDVAVYTERGYVRDLGLPLLGLAAIACLAVLLGTLTTTGLTLAETRPDLATLAAVGARPRTRRTMAAAQALVIGLLGAVAGTVVGAVPGLAVTWPLTADTLDPRTNSTYWGSPTIDVPWLLLLGVAIAVPVLAALTAGLAVRSRLPLTRRLGQ